MVVWGGLTNSFEWKRRERQRWKGKTRPVECRVPKKDQGEIRNLFSNQCKVAENNRMWKTRNLSKKIRDTKGTFHAKMGSIKDRNCMDIKEAEDTKKRWQEYTEELCKKKSSWPRYPQWCDHSHSPRARHPGMWSQVGLRKHRYEQS